jgi:hypothetical protein
MEAGRATVIQALMAWVWLPLLLGAGLLDWACHRRLRIEHTAGLRESLLHLAMLACVGGALMAALLLQPTAGLFLLVFAARVGHDVVYAADLNVALARRRIPALEQWVHGFQHLLPWAGLAGLVALAPGQALALVGASAEAVDWGLRWKTPPPWGTAAGVLAAALLCNVLPFLDETRRAWRAAARQAAA